jgi:hypothetical protein
VGGFSRSVQPEWSHVEHRAIVWREAGDGISGSGKVHRPDADMQRVILPVAIGDKGSVVSGSSHRAPPGHARTRSPRLTSANQQGGTGRTMTAEPSAVMVRAFTAEAMGSRAQ